MSWRSGNNSEDLPENWRRASDQEGIEYFWNQKTKETTYDRPQPLPRDWKETLDKSSGVRRSAPCPGARGRRLDLGATPVRLDPRTGARRAQRVYNWNKATKETSWVRPVEGADWKGVGHDDAPPSVGEESEEVGPPPPDGSPLGPSDVFGPPLPIWASQSPWAST